MRRALIAFAALFVIVVAAFLLPALSGECAGMGSSCVASARVEGRTYLTSVARAMVIKPGDLVRYATATRLNSGVATVDLEAYRLGDIDPTKVLVMRITPGQVDNAGPLGGFLLLVSDGAWSLTCPYFPSNDPLRPEQCAAASPTQGATPIRP